MLRRALRAVTTVSTPAQRVWNRVRTGVLTLGGFGALDVAAFRWSHTLGYVAVGLSLLVIETLSEAE